MLYIYIMLLLIIKNNLILLFEIYKIIQKQNMINIMH